MRLRQSVAMLGHMYAHVWQENGKHGIQQLLHIRNGAQHIMLPMIVLIWYMELIIHTNP